MNLLGLILAGHCVDNPALCEPTPPSAFATGAGITGSVLVLLSAGLAMVVCFGFGAGDGNRRMKWALRASVAMVTCAFLLLAVPGSTGSFVVFPLWALPPVAFAIIRFIKESGNPVLAKRLGMGLGIALGISGLLVVGAAIVFALAMSSWANSK